MALTDEAILRIKDMILRGELGPGDKLPREQDLAERLGLSRNSLREAVKALSLINVLDVRQGDGTYVTSLDPSLLLDAMAFVVDFHQDDSVLHFLEVRRSLETTAASLAASRIDPEETQALEAILDSVDEQSEVEAFVAADMEFHRLIAASAKNPVLASLLESLVAPLQRVRVWRGLTQTRAIAQTLLEHRGIFESIRAGEAELAGARMTSHIAGVEDWLRRAQVSGELDGALTAGTPSAADS